MSKSALSDLVKKVVKLLGAGSLTPPEKPESVPMERVVEAVLHDAADRPRVQKALKAIDEEFVDFNELRVAERSDLAEALDPIGPDVVDQAVILGGVLGDIIGERHALTLDHLVGEPRQKVEEALAKYSNLSDTAGAYIMLYGLGHNVVTVTHGMFRVLVRLEAIEEDSTAHEAQKKLDRAANRGDCFPLCEGLIEHAGTLCTEQAPKCAGCPLLSICPTGQRRTAEGKGGAKKKSSTKKSVKKKSTKKSARTTSSRSSSGRSAARKKTSKKNR